MPEIKFDVGEPRSAFLEDFMCVSAFFLHRQGFEVIMLPAQLTVYSSPKEDFHVAFWMPWGRNFYRVNAATMTCTCQVSTHEGYTESCRRVELTSTRIRRTCAQKVLWEQFNKPVPPPHVIPWASKCPRSTKKKNQRDNKPKKTISVIYCRSRLAQFCIIPVCVDARWYGIRSTILARTVFFYWQIAKIMKKAETD